MKDLALIKRGLFVLMGLFLLQWGCGRMEKEKLVEKLETRAEHLPINEHIGEGNALIEARIESTIGLPQAVLNYVVNETWQKVEMKKREDSEVYVAEIPHQDKGTVVNYYLDITTVTGTKIYLPEKALEGEYYTMTFKGKVAPTLLAIHITLMLVPMILLIIAAILAYRVITRGVSVSRCLWITVIAVILFFLGGFPVGIIVEKAVFGTFWEGWPFGRDVTDTKTGVIFLYWLVSLLMMKSSIFKKPETKNWVSDKTFAVLVIIGTIITLALYLIPHQNIKF